MLKKKILWILIVLWSCTACITQWNYILTWEWEWYQYWWMTNYLIDNNWNFLNSVTNQNQYLVYYWEWWLNSIYNWSWYNWKFTNQTLAQWIVWLYNYYSWYFLCDYQTNCWTPWNTSHLDSIDNFYSLDLNSKIDSVSIYDSNSFNNWNWGWVLCFDSSEINNSYCFPSGWYWQTFWDIRTQWFIWDSIDSDFTVWNGWDYATFLNKVQTIYWDSPFMWWWWSEEEQTVWCMNIKTQIMMYGASYNTWLCYTNDKQRSWSLYTWERVTVTPKSIFEIFTWFDSYKTRRNIYENSCHAPYTQEYCLARMQWNQEATEFFTKIDNAINNAWLTTITAEKVYQYCHLQLNFTEDEKRETDTCEAKEQWTYYATWITAEWWNQNPIEWLTNIVLEEWSEIILPNDGTVFDDVLPEWILSWKDVATDLNFMKTFVNLWRKFINLFVIRNQHQEWIIPPVISSLILIFIFYNIIKRKSWVK